VALLKLRSATGAGLYSVAVAPDGNLKGRNEVTNRTTRSSLAASDSTWHRLTVHLSTVGTPHVDVWLDGNKVDALSKDDTFGGTNIGTVQIGENVAGRSFAGALDNVQIDDSPIAP
jgi:Concanavalin A-like lectin/glucanases superfamily